MTSGNSFLSFLTPGSVWVRKSGAEQGKRVSFLWLSNANLNAQAMKSHPPQVIYADEQANVYNREIDDFFNRYKFFNVDGALENRLNALLAFDEDSIDDDEDEDIAVVEADEEDEVASREAGEESDEIASLFDSKTEVKASNRTLAQTIEEELNDNAAVSDCGVSFTFSEGTKVLSEEQLVSALVSYAQSPLYSNSVTQHSLTFRLDDTVTSQKLKRVFFGPAGDASVYSFSFDAEGEEVEVVWTYNLGMYLSKVGATYMTVIVGTDGIDGLDTAEAEEAEEAEEQEQDQVEEQAAEESESEPTTEVVDVEFRVEEQNIQQAEVTPAINVQVTPQQN